jgi:hypothetical protein
VAAHGWQFAVTVLCTSARTAYSVSQQPINVVCLRMQHAIGRHLERVARREVWYGVFWIVIGAVPTIFSPKSRDCSNMPLNRVTNAVLKHLKSCYWRSLTDLILHEGRASPLPGKGAVADVSMLVGHKHPLKKPPGAKDYLKAIPPLTIALRSLLDRLRFEFHENRCRWSNLTTPI